MKTPCNYTTGFVRLALLILSLSGLAPLFAQTTAQPLVLLSSNTNFNTRYITNVIQVSIPTNVFVDEFRTNWVHRDITNVVELYRTNFVPHLQTNIVDVERIMTNYMIAYRTNFKDFTITNWADVFVTHTNFVTRPVTNIVELTNTVVREVSYTNFVTEFQTNVAFAFQTNHKTITLTNFETVLVMQTNWVTQPVTNVVKIDLPAAATASIVEAPSAAPVAAEPVRPELPQSASASDLAQKLEFVLTHIGAPNRELYPVKLVLRSSSGATLPVHEWRVEKVDGSALIGGSRAEFTGSLPAGSYKIVARVRSDDGAIRTVRGITEVKFNASTVTTSGTLSAGATASR